MCFLPTYFNFLPSNLSSVKQNSLKFVSIYINQIGIQANNENVKLKLLHKRRYIPFNNHLIVSKMYKKPTDFRHMVIKTQLLGVMHRRQNTSRVSSAVHPGCVCSLPFSKSLINFSQFAFLKRKTNALLQIYI